PAPRISTSRARTSRSRCEGSHSRAVEAIRTVLEPSRAASAASRRGVRKSRWIGPLDSRHARPPTTSTAAATSRDIAVTTVPATLHICCPRPILLLRARSVSGGRRNPPRRLDDDGRRALRRAPAVGSEAVELRDPLAVERRIAEGDLVGVRPLEPELQVELPREADAAVHLHGTSRRAAVDVAQARLRHGGRARRLAR